MGLGIERNIQQAYDFYRYAADRNKWWASERLSVLCYDPESPFHDPQAGWDWFLLALEQAGASQESWQSALKDSSIENDFPYGPFFNIGIWVSPSKQSIRNWYIVGAMQGDAYCEWKLAVLMLNRFFGHENETEEGRGLLENAIRKKLPHALAYAASVYGDPQYRFYDPSRASAMGNRASRLGFPPRGPYINPAIPDGE